MFELPIAYGDEQDSLVHDPGGKFTFGNPYAGLRSLGSDDVRLEVGARLPTAAEDNRVTNSYGLFSDLDRCGAFAVNAVTLRALADMEVRNDYRTFVRARHGVTMLYFTDQTGDAEVMWVYAFQSGYRGDVVGVWGGLNGILALTAEHFIARDRGTLEAHFGIDLNPGQIQPGGHVRLPVTGDLNARVLAFYGLNVTINLE